MKLLVELFLSPFESEIHPREIDDVEDAHSNNDIEGHLVAFYLVFDVVHAILLVHVMKEPVEYVDGCNHSRATCGNIVRHLQSLNLFIVDLEDQEGPHLLVRVQLGQRKYKCNNRDPLLLEYVATQESEDDRRQDDTNQACQIVVLLHGQAAQTMALVFVILFVTGFFKPANALHLFSEELWLWIDKERS